MRWRPVGEAVRAGRFVGEVEIRIERLWRRGAVSTSLPFLLSAGDFLKAALGSIGAVGPPTDEIVHR